MTEPLSEIRRRARISEDPHIREVAEEYPA
jgi:hypothetical protein